MLVSQLITGVWETDMAFSRSIDSREKKGRIRQRQVVHAYPVDARKHKGGNESLPQERSPSGDETIGMLVYGWYVVCYIVRNGSWRPVHHPSKGVDLHRTFLLNVTRRHLFRESAARPSFQCSSCLRTGLALCLIVMHLMALVPRMYTYMNVYHAVKLKLSTRRRQQTYAAGSRRGGET